MSNLKDRGVEFKILAHSWNISKRFSWEGIFCASRKENISQNP